VTVSPVAAAGTVAAVKAPGLVAPEDWQG
jgi:hypothetical protein